MRKFIIEGLGWYGVVAILSAYGLLSFGYLQADALVYQLLNATGAIGIMIDAYYAKNYQPVVLNIVWFGIALIAIISLV